MAMMLVAITVLKQMEMALAAVRESAGQPWNLEKRQNRHAVLGIGAHAF